MLEGYGKLELIFESKRTSVWRGERLSDGRGVIVKRPRSDYPTASEIARYAHEYGILKELSGALGVVEVIDLARSGGVPALVLVEVPGARDLAREMADSPKDFGVRLGLAVRMAEALGQVHARGVIHKDISPANILVSASTEGT
jgi:histidine kinase